MPYCLEFFPIVNIDPPITEHHFVSLQSPTQAAFDFGVWWAKKYPSVEATLQYRPSQKGESTDTVAAWYVKRMRKQGDPMNTQVLGTLIMRTLPVMGMP